MKITMPAPDLQSPYLTFPALCLDLTDPDNPKHETVYLSLRQEVAYSDMRIDAIVPFVRRTQQGIFGPVVDFGYFEYDYLDSEKQETIHTHALPDSPEKIQEAYTRFLAETPWLDDEEHIKSLKR